MPSPTPHEREAWRRRLAAAFLGLALLLAAAALARLFQAQRKLAEVVRWQTHTYQLLRALDQAMESIQEVDSTQRGYLVTGDARYLRHHEDAKGALKDHFAAIRALAADSPAQTMDLAELTRLEDTRMDTEARVIQARDAGDEAGIQRIIQEARGKGSMEDIRAIHGRMVDRELHLRDLRERAVLQGHEAATRGIEILALSAALFVAVGLVMLLRLQRERGHLEAAWLRSIAILDNTPDFIATAAPDGRLTYLNPALRRLIGLGAGAQPDGWAVFKALGPEAALSEASKAGVWVGESAYMDSKGRPLPVSQVILAHRDGHGRLTGFSAIARDIHAQKATERLKDDFVSTVNHELRTPLTSIKGALGLLLAGQAGALPDGSKQMVEIAHRNSERLSRIIDDILDLQKLETEGIGFHMAPQDLGALLAQSREAMEPFFAERGVRLVFHPGPAGLLVRVDEGRFLQVLANLLSNAAKFSPEGGVVGFRTLPAPGPPGRVRVEVENAGPGIPGAFHPRVFQPFSQAEASTGERQGTGLGLSIAKRIIERLGGRIGFESEPGRTVFWVELPEAQAADGDTLDP